MRNVGDITAGRDKPNPETVQTFYHLAEGLGNFSGDIGNKTVDDVAIELYEFSKWDLDQIQTVLTPRVIQSRGEQELIDALIAFDTARRALHSGIISHKLIVTGAAFPRLVSLVEEAGDLYQVLCKYWATDG